ncbi:putative aspartyl protease [Ophiocordyceps polyrhachis-furcata BCC 54312]|uniref:Aspartyl protease n=1 Tax=Ophiocordyceps polyrhachis-furcata BCC 54312 TaxID=1330021 RepID=A0A367LHU9_9HYPO|nr:putative aspartyl protease [Ophiocordyceps polyrhachis-furcata BCC 54312]
MKFVCLLLALGSVAVAVVEQRQRVLKIDFRRGVVVGGRSGGGLRRRDGTVNSTLQNRIGLYTIDIGIGNPPQRISALIDTGSSDALINTNVSQLCEQSSRPCVPSGTYNANASSTSQYINSLFNISYVDGSGAAGDFVADDVRISGKQVRGVQIGVAYKSSSPQSVLGIGLSSNEAQAARGGGRRGGDEYVNFPAKMADDGVIASNSYSLWLNDISAPDGSVLFGGVDSDRYVPPLVAMPMQKVDGKFSEFFITMTSISLNNDTLADNLSLAVLLDSGSTFSYLPNKVAQSVYSAVNARFNDQSGAAFVPCSLASSDASLRFNFSSPASVTVPLRELVIDPTSLSGRPVNFGDGVPACYLGIMPSGGSSGSSANVLGDTFLRSAYVVYDLQGKTIALANTRFNVTASNVQEIPPDGKIPGAEDARDPVRATTGLPGQRSGGTAAGAPFAAVVLALVVSIMIGYA